MDAMDNEMYGLTILSLPPEERALFDAWWSGRTVEEKVATDAVWLALNAARREATGEAAERMLAVWQSNQNAYFAQVKQQMLEEYRKSQARW